MHFYAGQAQIARVDRELGGVKVKNGIAVDQLIRIHQIVADLLDLLPGVGGVLLYFFKYFLPAQGQAAPGYIQ